jgi:hypothetical protein
MCTDRPATKLRLREVVMALLCLWHALALGLCVALPRSIAARLESVLRESDTFLILPRFFLWVATTLAAMGPTFLGLLPLVLATVAGAGCVYSLSARGRSSFRRSPTRHLAAHLCVAMAYQIWFLLLLLSLVLPSRVGYSLPLR